ncbi:MAG: zinc ribbon domain-containing protein [archaeon]|nr:zinc ribbon domain-containing protein [archaeon]
MKCSKCDIEIKEDNKYCPNCGKKIEESSSDIDNLVKDCSRVWFIFGFMKGCTKDKNSLTDFEKLIKKKSPEIWTKYEDIINYWKDIANQNEKIKKTNGSKPTGISEIKGVKT